MDIAIGVQEVRKSFDKEEVLHGVSIDFEELCDTVCEMDAGDLTATR